MNRLIIALGLLACIAVAACSGGGSSNSVPQAAAPGTTATTTTPGSSTATAGKAAVTISFAVPPKGTSAQALRRSPQWISPNTTTVSAVFTATGGGGTNTSGSAACSSSCSLQVFVTPGTYNVLISAGDANGTLSDTVSNGFTVTLGAANSLSVSPLVEVLSQVQLSASPVLPANVYNGQNTSTTVTANLLDVDGNLLSQPGPWNDNSGTQISGLVVTPNSNNGTMTINGTTAAYPLNSATQNFTVNYNGTDTLGSQVNIATSTSSGSVASATLFANVLSPFLITQVNPAPYNGTAATYGNPQITNSNTAGTASIEYPSLTPVSQSLTITDYDTAPANPVTIDPSGCNGYISSFTANSVSYSGVPIPVTYQSPIPITYTNSAGAPANCTISITDSYSTPDTYPLNLFFDQNSLYVSSQKRASTQKTTSVQKSTK